MGKELRVSIAAVGLTALSLCPGIAAAEDRTDQIVVTGLRQPKPLKELAGNTSRLEAEELSRIGAHHPSEALNRLPGVFVHRGNGQEHLTAIRSPVLTGGAGAGSFLYLEDGVPLRAAGFGNVNGLFESTSELAGALEVVRGPGSALYGSNAVHGLINVVPLRPGDETLLLEGAAGSFQRYSGRLTASHGKEGGGEIFSVSLVHEGGYISAAGLDQQKAYASMERPFGDGQVRLSIAGTNLNQETAGFIRGVDAYKDRTLSRTNPNPEAYRDAKSARLSLAIDQPGVAGGRWSVTPFGRYTEMEFRQHFLPSRAVEENGHWSLGVLLRHDWRLEEGHLVVLGLDAEYTEGYLWEFQANPDTAFPPPYPQGLHYDFDVVAEVVAPYVHTEWQWTDKLRTTLEARYEFTKYDYDTSAPVGVNGRLFVPADRSDDYQAFTPAAGVVYAATDQIDVYGRYARGARAPQVTDLYRLQLNQTVGDIDEETLDSFELGLRRQGENTYLAVTAFHMDKDNFFFRDGDGFNVTDGKTRHLGVELEGFVELGHGISMSGAATYAHHTYRFSRAANGIASGNDVDTAPRLLANAEVNWEVSPNLSAHLHWRHVGRYYTDASNNNDYPGHDLFDARLNWQMTPAWSANVAVRNLTNTDYAERADFAFGSERYFPGEGRAFEVRLSYRPQAE